MQPSRESAGPKSDVVATAERSKSDVVATVETPKFVPAPTVPPRCGHLFVLGAGVVGAEVLAQATSLPPIERGPALDLKVVGVARRRGGAYDVRGFDRAAVAHIVSERRATVAGDEAVPSTNAIDFPARSTQLEALARLSDPVLIDCTAADGMEAVYEEALLRGIHVVTANKKALVARRDLTDRIFAAAAKTGRSFRYEATVGAGLPVIGTLQGLVRTGDRVKSIECALSGTLGYIANELSKGVPLSVAVATAKSLGYTEPDPREDLAGTDVARKAVILARELGIPLELEHVTLTPFVPQEALDAPDLETALVDYDAAFAARMAELRTRGERLVYLARISVEGTRAAYRCEVKVGPVAVPLDHPAASLDGPTALVAFTTERYGSSPLVVRGAGAGGPVTASAVLSDVFLTLSGAPVSSRGARGGAVSS